MSEYTAPKPLDTSRDVAWLAEADNARSGFGRHMHGLGSARNGVDEPEGATDPDAGPLVGATVLVAALGPARSDCAKKMGAGETKHVLNHDKACWV